MHNLERLSESELAGAQVVKGEERGPKSEIYRSNQLCKVCSRQPLSCYHKFDVCMSCIINAAKLYDVTIDKFDTLMLPKFAEIRWKVWRQLRIRERKPV